MAGTVRTRFAPSPTGYLHVGSARTAMYCWLYARKNQGKFILRIEDTDIERSTVASVEAILDSMDWLELHYDEGPYYQTKRFDRYKEVVQQLLAEDKAYRCYCSKERLEELRAHQTATQQKPRYDGHCRNLIDTSPDKPHVVRFCNPLDGEVIVDDQVFGPVVFKNTELDDLIIARTDGTPTYNFTVVVDDLDMKITHVIRGDDHLNNTPRQINILQALGAQLPIYAHIPMILGSDGKRLSKRHGAVSVMLYRDEGYLPEALLNYLIRLGWSHGDQEIFSIQEMIDLFDIKDVNKAPAAFDPQKLLWLNQHYLKTSDPVKVGEHLRWQMENLGLSTESGPSLAELVTLQCDRAKTLKEMAERSRFFYEDIPMPQHIALAAQQFIPALISPFQVFRKALANLADWSSEAIHKALVETAEQYSLSLGKLAQPVRIAVTGGTVSPPIDGTVRLLGKEKTLIRLDRAIAFMQEAREGLIA
jgi:glutamyl-tRNA synthetase